MRHGFVALLLAVALAAQGTGRAAEPGKPNTSETNANDHDAAAKLVREAMDRLKANGVPAFLDVVFSGNATTLKKEDRPAGEPSFTKLHDAAVARYGEPVGEVELVRTDAVGRSLVRFVYLEKLERMAIAWTFSFYRGADGWKLVAFNLSDQLEAEFRTAKPGEAAHEAAGALAGKAVDGLKAGGVSKLLDAAFSPDRSSFPAGSRAGAEPHFARLREAAGAPHGKPTGEVELVRAEAVGQSLVRFVYLEKCERGAVAWKFTFYRAGREWKWLDVTVNGDFTSVIPARP